MNEPVVVIAVATFAAFLFALASLVVRVLALPGRVRRNKETLELYRRGEIDSDEAVRRIEQTEETLP